MVIIEDTNEGRTIIAKVNEVEANYKERGGTIHTHTDNVWMDLYNKPNWNGDKRLQLEFIPRNYFVNNAPYGELPRISVAVYGEDSVEAMLATLRDLRDALTATIEIQESL